MEKNVSAQLVEFALGVQYDSIPKEVVEFTKCLTLKTIAGTLAGSAKPSGKKMARLIQGKKLPGEAGVIGGGFKTSLWEAVLLNGFFAHASELEDDRIDESGAVSWDITLIPLLLPLAEKLELSGKRFLEALVAGLEVHARTCRFNPDHLGQLIVPGAVGPAVGASKALGLNPEETMAAIGLAMSGVPLWIKNFGTDGHYFESAMMSLQGIIAAEMAQMGLSGNPDVATYLTEYLGKERVVPGRMVEDLGKRWTMQEVWIKKYPVCLMQHRHIDMILALKKEENLSFADVEAIEVHARRPREVACDRPNPQTEGDLQFSFQHNLAVAMLHGDVTLEYITPEATMDPDLRAAREKVKYIADYSSGDAAAALQEPARIVVRMKDGRTFSRERKYPIGHPKEPLSRAQFQEFFHKFTKGILPKKNVDKSSQAVLNLEKMKNVKELMNILRAGD